MTRFFEPGLKKNFEIIYIYIIYIGSKSGKKGFGNVVD
jgi:hypothetical protein